MQGTIRQTISYRNGIFTDPLGNSTSLQPQSLSKVDASIAVFGRHYIYHHTNTEGVNELGNARIYSLKFYDGSVIVRNFVPCYSISDGEAGLYDTVNGVFYSNQGTGEFIKGPTVGWSGVICPDIYDFGTIHAGRYLEVDYIEAPVDEYHTIVTGYYANEKTKVEAVFSRLTDVNDYSTRWQAFYVFYSEASSGDVNAFGFIDASSGDNHMFFYHPGMENVPTKTDTGQYHIFIISTGISLEKDKIYKVTLSPTGFSWVSYDDGSIITSTNLINYRGTFTTKEPLWINAAEFGMRIYSFIISEIDGGVETVVKKLVPVYDLFDNSYGLYDIMSNDFIVDLNNVALSGPPI